MKIKSFVVTAVLVTAILCSGVAVSAQTTDVSALIAQIKAQIASLMAQLQTLQAQQSTTQAWCHTFNRNLKFGDVAQVGDTGDEVYDLQTALEKEGFAYAKKDNANSGSGGMIFGENTASAVVEFQEKYASEILTPLGLKHGTGVVASATRKKLNALYGCVTQSECKIDSDCPQMIGNSTGLFPSSKCIDGKCVLTPTTCTPNWTCSWGPCKNGWQSYVITDSNNCGLSASNVSIACPALAQQCPIQSSITVLSPNGGETWQKGTTQTIKWQDNIPVPQCPADAYCAQVARFYDIKLIQARPYCPPCVAGAVCVACNIQAPYTIATSVSGYSYSWGVGKILSNYFSNPVPDGAYTVQICQTGTDTCDSSDSYFKITSSASTNLPPVISGGIAPTTLNVNQTGTWTINASDPENGPLNYSVNWGDAIVAPISYSASAQSAFIQTSTFTHSYSSAGIYTVTFTVMDNAGLTAQTSSTVQVSSVCPPVQCLLDSCPNRHLPDANGCINCSTPCSVQSSIKITSPIANSTITNKSLKVSGTCSGYSGAIKVFYYSNEKKEITTQCISGSWSADIYIDSNAGSGSFSLYAQLYPDNTYIQDQISVYFNWYNIPSITVTSPNGGEVWTKDSVHNIIWTGQGSNATNVDIRLVETSRSSLYNTFYIIRNININQQIYAWNVGYVYSTAFNPVSGDAVLEFPSWNGQYKIQICEAGTSNCDSSDNYLSITAP